MRGLDINKQTITYALCKGSTEKKDSFGNYTGETAIEYDTPVTVRMNVSPASGHAKLKEFGIVQDYDYVALTHDMECPIKEDTIIWYDAPATGTYNCMVSWIAKGLNTIRYGLKKVTASE